jgi:sulfur-oxidizing protein SoxY
MTHRRRFLITLGTLAAGGGLLSNASAQSQSVRPTLRDAIRKVVGAASPKPGRIKIDLPPLIENGNAVPLTVSVDSAMTATDHVKAIHVVNEKNPQAEIASFYLGPRAGRALISTRIRLADTQTVVALAQMNDGTFWSAEAHVVVTIAACLEELA